MEHHSIISVLNNSICSSHLPLIALIAYILILMLKKNLLMYQIKFFWIVFNKPTTCTRKIHLANFLVLKDDRTGKQCYFKWVKTIKIIYCLGVSRAEVQDSILFIYFPHPLVLKFIGGAKIHRFIIHTERKQNISSALNDTVIEITG